MNDMTLKRKRDEAIYACYKEGLEQGCFNSWRDAGDWVSQHGAPQYFVSPKLASRLVGQIINRTSLMHLNNSSRQLAWDLYIRYNSFVRANPKSGLSRERILEEILCEPAPSFYLSPESIRKIIKAENDKVASAWKNL